VKITVIIPAYNEELTIAHVVKQALHYADEVLVIDDGSSDNTTEVAKSAGARVIEQNHGGYLKAIKRGFREATGDIVVTLDADGEHQPAQIPKLVQPIAADTADMVLGSRKHIARPSERLISFLCRHKTKVWDTGTGFRAIRRGLAVRLTFPGMCICGTSVLEVQSLGARTIEVPITLNGTSKPRKIAWNHIFQMFYVIKMLLTPTQKNKIGPPSK